MVIPKRLVHRPSRFDVIVAEDTFGDIAAPGERITGTTEVGDIIVSLLG